MKIWGTERYLEMHRWIPFNPAGDGNRNMAVVWWGGFLVKYTPATVDFKERCPASCRLWGVCV